MLINFVKTFIYLAASSLSCGLWELLLQCSDSLGKALKLRSCSAWA